MSKTKYLTLKQLKPSQNMLTQAPDSGAYIGGLKVVAENGWFAARPSG